MQIFSVALSYPLLGKTYPCKRPLLETHAVSYA